MSGTTTSVYELARSNGPCFNVASAAGHPATHAVPPTPTMAIAAAIGNRTRINANSATKPRAAISSSFIDRATGEALVGMGD
jgi:hypothetical protein